MLGVARIAVGSHVAPIGPQATAQASRGKLARVTLTWRPSHSVDWPRRGIRRTVADPTLGSARGLAKHLQRAKNSQASSVGRSAPCRCRDSSAREAAHAGGLAHPSPRAGRSWPTLTSPDNRERRAPLDLEGRLRHVHILGLTGTGKSTLLVWMIIQDIPRRTRRHSPDRPEGRSGSSRPGTAPTGTPGRRCL